MGFRKFFKNFFNSKSDKGIPQEGDLVECKGHNYYYGPIGTGSPDPRCLNRLRPSGFAGRGDDKGGCSGDAQIPSSHALVRVIYGLHGLSRAMTKKGYRH